nr:MAG TPA: repressor domain protein [Caudoviricetes sp.]
MTDIQIFKNEQFGVVRTIAKDGEPWFVANDICKVLGHTNSRVAVAALDEDEKGVSKVYTLGGEQQMTVVNEAGMYQLVIRSNLPAAKAFKRWITHEVIPTIRRHGAYATETTIESIIADPESGIKLLQALKAEQERRKEAEAIAEAQRSKALFADAVAASDNSILVGELAKILRQNGVETGQNRLFRWMRDNGYIMRYTNVPTQYSMERGLMEVKERAINNPDGSVRITQTIKVTGKGIVYFVNKFIGGMDGGKLNRA